MKTFTSDSEAACRPIIDRCVADDEPFLWKNPAKSQRLDLDAVLKTHGQAEFRCSANLYHLDVKDGEERMSLDDYLQRSPHVDFGTIPLDAAPAPYVFHDVRLEPGTEPAGSLMDPPPDFFTELSEQYPVTAARIALGPAGSYCGLHRHGAACNSLGFGLKYWQLFPPNTAKRLQSIFRAMRVRSPQLLWTRHFDPIARAESGDIVDRLKAKALELQSQDLMDLENCRAFDEPFAAVDALGTEFHQQPGDTVFVPPLWGHWILNQAWTLATIYELNFIADRKQTRYSRQNWDHCYIAEADRWSTPLPNPTLVGLIAGLNLSAGSKILDLGCGTGTNAIYFAQQGYRVVGVDISDAALQKARQTARRLNQAVEWVNRDVVDADAAGWDHADHSADLIVDLGCLHSLELKDWSRYAAVARRCLKPTGQLVVLGCGVEAADSLTSLTPDRIANLRPFFTPRFFSLTPLTTGRTLLQGAVCVLTPQ